MELMVVKKPPTLLVAVAAFGVAKLTEQRMTDHLNAMGKDYFNSIDEKNSNHVSEQISVQVSNQIAAEFRQPRIKAAMEQVAADRAQDLLTNAVWASLETFRARPAVTRGLTPRSIEAD